MTKAIGISMPLPPPLPENSIDGAFFGREAERLGFESVWCGEHIIAPVSVTKSSSPFFEGGQVPGFQDPLIALARVSAVTKSIKLGPSVLLVPERNPILLAKEIATLDMYSGGRFILGVGAGWLQEESEIMGVDFPHRWSQAIEALRAMKELWTKDQAEFHGKYYDFPPVRCYPKPASKPHPPILFGGVAPTVEKRVVAHGDAWGPERVTPEQLKDRVRNLYALAEEAGRDPGAIQISVFGKKPEADIVSSYLEAGADRVVVGMFSPVIGEAECLSQLEEIARTILPLARKF